MKNTFYFSLDIVKSGTSKDNKFFIEGYAVTQDLDRQGDIIVLDALEHAAAGLLEFGNTVFFNHDYNRCVGRLDEVKVDNVGLWVKIYISQWEEELRKKIEEGIIGKFSIGGRVMEGERVQPTEAQRRFNLKTRPTEAVKVISRMELFEVSVVGLPANAHAEFAHKSLCKALEDMSHNEELFALKDAGQIPDNTTPGTPLPKPIAKDMEVVDIKSVIPFEAHEKAPENEKWNGPSEIKKAEVKDLKVMCAWYDEKAPEVKGSYKLPHHKADGYATVWAGVRAAMGALMGARGGVSIPEDEKQGVYNHLAKHYKQFEKTPPEFKKDYTPEELKSIEGEVEETIMEEVKKDEVVKEAVVEATKELEAIVAQEVKKEEVPAEPIATPGVVKETAPEVVKQEEAPVEETKKEEQAVAAPVVITEQAQSAAVTTIDPANGKMTQEAIKEEIVVTETPEKKITETVAVHTVRTYTEEEVNAIKALYEKQLEEKEVLIKTLSAKVDEKIEKADPTPAPEAEPVTKDLQAEPAKEEVEVTTKSTPLAKDTQAPIVVEEKKPFDIEKGFLNMIKGKHK